MISIIITHVVTDEDGERMAGNCVVSYHGTKNLEDEIVFVKDTECKGNAWAWNEGARRAKGDVFLFSDDDIFAIKWRDEMLFNLQNYGVAFPRMYNLKLQDIEEHLAGECWMITRDLFENMGGVSEEYGQGYFEDTDFFKKVQDAGYRLGIAKDTLMVHKSQGTFSKIKTPEELKDLFNKNKKIYENKYGSVYPHLNL